MWQMYLRDVYVKRVVPSPPTRTFLGIRHAFLSMGGSRDGPKERLRGRLAVLRRDSSVPLFSLECCPVSTHGQQWLVAEDKPLGWSWKKTINIINNNNYWLICDQAQGQDTSWYCTAPSSLLVDANEIKDHRSWDLTNTRTIFTRFWKIRFVRWV